MLVQQHPIVVHISIKDMEHGDFIYPFVLNSKTMIFDIGTHSVTSIG